MKSPLRMITFAPSGASAPSRYRNWNNILTELHLDQDLAVIPVDRPGADARWKEDFIDTMPRLVENMMTTLGPITDGAPFVLAGHSVGGLIAYELAHALTECGLRLPQALVIFGHNAPDQMTGRVSLQGKTPDEAFAFLRSLGGVPDEMLDDPEAAQAMLLPQLLADDALSSTYTYAGARPLLSVPIIAVWAEQDPQTSEAAMLAWRAHTSGPFFFHRTPGAHFALYHRDVTIQVLRAVHADLCDARLVGGRS
jgi:medium-chain acyl-[acyl-carrier-protein] hydrolase